MSCVEEMLMPNSGQQRHASKPLRLQGIQPQKLEQSEFKFDYDVFTFHGCSIYRAFFTINPSIHPVWIKQNV
jgi:hypothetical protein